MTNWPLYLNRVRSGIPVVTFKRFCMAFFGNQKRLYKIFSKKNQNFKIWPQKKTTNWQPCWTEYYSQPWKHYAMWSFHVKWYSKTRIFYLTLTKINWWNFKRERSQPSELNNAKIFEIGPSTTFQKLQAFVIFMLF